jgi:hypothetical protein
VLNVVRIFARCTGDAITSVPEAAEADWLEAAVSNSKRAQIYSIYFSLSSDVIRDESEQTICEVMRRHPDWKWRCS